MRISSLVATITLSLTLAACNFNPESEADADPAAQVSSDASADQNGADEMASNDPAPGEQADMQIPDSEERPTMQMQVVLDRQGFTPGVVDGRMGMSTKNAIRGFQEANDLEVTGEANEETKAAMQQWSNIPATRVVTIPASFAQEQFEDIPDSAEAKAKMDRLGYTSLDEKLAERFHTTIDTLKRLNPDGKPAGMTAANEGAAANSASANAASTTAPSKQKQSSQPTKTAAASTDRSSTDGSNGSERMANADESYFKAGQQIRVPNIGADKIASGSVDDEGWLATLRTLGVGTDQPKVDRVVVSESAGTLKAYDSSDKLVAMYTATMGSENDPLPIGDWKILGVAHNPPFAYNPELFWDVPDSEEKQMMPPGPNGPVGVVWIDLSKEHYGIHGTPEPQTIGRVQSHGCIRLTNWDAARLAQMVHSGTKAVFET